MSDHFETIKYATSFINNTGCHVFITGRAGTGKTTFLRNLMATTHKKAIVAAPTGIAAINAGGITLHSLFQLPFGTFVPSLEGVNVNTLNANITTHQGLISKLNMNSTKSAMLRELELLVIDEVSMLRADLLDAIDVVLRHIRRNNQRAFGGVQVLLIGDLLQLPPVVKQDEWNLLKWHYPSMYFFDAKVLQGKSLVYLELESIFRQSEARFIKLLDNFRVGATTPEDIELLQSKHKPSLDPTTKEGWIYLTTHNRKADTINLNALEKLKGKMYSFDARVADDFPEHQYPVEFTLQLKVGAQVMFIKNDYSGNKLYFNGKLGIIDSIDDDIIVVSFPDGSDPATVEPYTWENKKYTLDTETNEISEKVEGTFSHLPIKLAWAITIHKSQGLTFDNAIIDFADAFAAGQAYVALSRLRSLDGLLLATPLPTRHFTSDDSISSFSENKKSKQELEKELARGTLVFVQDEVEKTFNIKTIAGLFQALIYNIKGGKGKSKKIEFIPWLHEQREKIEAVDEVAKKFVGQLNKNGAFGSKKNLPYLLERLKKSEEFFEPALKKVSEEIVAHAKEASETTGNKQYIRELEVIEALVRARVKAIFKLSKLVESILKNQTLDKQATKNPLLDQAGSSRKQSFEEMAGKKRTKKKSKEKKEKETKIPSRDISFELFKAGNSIDEIAVERGFAISTIEGHLSYFVSQKLLDASQFVEPEKIQVILEAAESVKSKNLTEIIKVMGGEFTYGDLRFVLAQYQDEIFLDDEK